MCTYCHNPTLALTGSGMAYEQPFKDIFGVGHDRHMTTKDVISKMVCNDGGRDCHMGECGQCKDFALALKDEVTKVFNDLEIDEVI